MDTDNLDFLDGDAPAEHLAAPEAEASQAEPAPEGPIRGPDGRFAPREAAPEPQAPEIDPQPAPEPQAPQIPPGYVPVSVVQELRQEIRNLKQAPQHHEAAPDPYEDPSGYAVYQSQAVEQRLLNERLNFSERFARREHGADTVDKAREWALGKFQADPLYYQRVMSDADPYEAVVQDWKREQVLSSMKDGDLDAFLAWKSGQAPPQAAASAAPPPAPTPPRSLASAPSAGGAKPGEQPVGPGVAFDSLFKG